MKLYNAIRHYSKICLQKKLPTHKIFLAIHNKMFKINLIKHKSVTSEELYSKSLDNSQILYKNQFTCLLTKCVFCHKTCLYINKITGKYI